MMSSLDFETMEQQARQLRAEAIRHIQGLVFRRMRHFGQLIAVALLTGFRVISETLRPLFSWNPQRPASRRHVSQS